MQRIATHALRQKISSKEMFDRKINPNKTFSCTVCLFFLSHLSVCSGTYLPIVRKGTGRSGYALTLLFLDNLILKCRKYVPISIV